VSWGVLQGDCIERMAEMEEASVTAVVCDPPYGLEFMGREWDRLDTRQPDDPTFHRSGVGPFDRSKVRYSSSASYGGAVGPAMQEWHHRWALEALRVLKPGGHLLAFGGTRTYHRLACAIEDAGFEIRDSIMWLYGTGFPKSLNVGRANAGKVHRHHGDWNSLAKPALESIGTALKPSHEPIVVARKPLVGTVAANVLQHGTGGLNIDACRIGTESTERPNGINALGVMNDDDWQPSAGTGGSSAGRWPANVVLSHTEDCIPVGTRVVKPSNGSGVASERSGSGEASGDRRYTEKGSSNFAPTPGRGGGTETVEAWECTPGCPVAALDAQTGELKSGFMAAGTERAGLGYQGGLGNRVRNDTHGDSGGASRFFYCAKASRAERDAGLEGFEERLDAGVWGGADDDLSEGKKPTRPRANGHPTVKPIDLMRWLVRLVTPPGGLILDPFLGSGTTGCAAVLEGFNFIGIEREPEYVEIAKGRIAFWEQHAGESVDAVLRLTPASRRAAEAHSQRGQEVLDLGEAA